MQNDPIAIVGAARTPAGPLDAQASPARGYLTI
jgi:hypothetical protein